MAQKRYSKGLNKCFKGQIIHSKKYGACQKLRSKMAKKEVQKWVNPWWTIVCFYTSWTNDCFGKFMINWRF